MHEAALKPLIGGGLGESERERDEEGNSWIKKKMRKLLDFNKGRPRSRFSIGGMPLKGRLGLSLGLGRVGGPQSAYFLVLTKRFQQDLEYSLLTQFQAVPISRQFS